MLTPEATSYLFPFPPSCNVSAPWPRTKLTDEGSKPLLVVAMVGSNTSETAIVLHNLDRTTTKCHNEVKPGFFHMNNIVSTFCQCGQQEDKSKETASSYFFYSIYLDFLLFH